MLRGTFPGSVPGRAQSDRRELSPTGGATVDPGRTQHRPTEAPGFRPRCSAARLWTWHSVRSWPDPSRLSALWS
jgi:hypothetical protein